MNGIEKAIKTIKVAIAEVDWNYPLDYAIAFETAIEALTEKLQRLENPPLTLEELKQMEGKPVYVVDTYMGIKQWYIVGECDWFTDGYEDADTEYEENWLAYRHEKGEENV